MQRAPLAAAVLGCGIAFVWACQDAPMIPQGGDIEDGFELPDAPPQLPPSGDVGIQVHNGEPNCLNDLPGAPNSRFQNPTCEANEVEIKRLTVADQTTPIQCIENDPVDVDLIAFFGLNAKDRFDASYYLALDGGDARTGHCFHGILEPLENGTAEPTTGPPFDGPFRNLEEGDPADVCGDIAEADEITIADPLDPTQMIDVGAILEVPQTLTITCVDPDGDGFTSIGTCTSWDNNQQDTCTGVDDAVPGTPSKCFCQDAVLPITVIRQAHVKVKKSVTNEVGTPGTFLLEIFDAADDPQNGLIPGTLLDSKDDAVDGDMTQRVEITWTQGDEPLDNTVFVDEDAGTNSPRGLEFYTTSYQCVDVADNNAVVASGTGTSEVELTLVSGMDIECTFTNDRIPLPTLTVTKTVDNEDFDRSWSWAIDKRVFKEGTPTQGCETLGEDIEDQTLELILTQQLIACYTVEVTPTPTDDNFSADGTITVTATGNVVYASTALTITDEVDPGDNAATVSNCSGTSLDLSGDGSDSVTCDWSFSYTGTPSGTQTNTATADVTWNSGDSDSESDAKTFDFSGGPTTETDESIDVFDTWNAGTEFQLGTRLGDDGTHTFTFSRNLECPSFGTTLIPNTSRFESNDTPLTGSDDADVSVRCDPPPQGCVLTQGYWKNHSSFGPAPFDDGWDVVTGTEAGSCSVGPDGDGMGADVEFGHEWPSPFTQAIDSDQCYYDVFRTQGKGGNAWYPLAHQYIAAWLNVEAGGASSAPIAEELEAAANLLAFYDTGANPDNTIPKQGDAFCSTLVAGDPGFDLCSQFGKDRQVAIQLNNILTQYNEGDLGVESCDDDATSLLP